jgi:four helix bundle protein
MAVQSHKDLEVWQKAMGFVTTVYAITKQFPKEELYGLTSQIRRSAVSIPSNIAEGRSKRSTREFIRFVNIACGSAAELETQLMISHNLNYIASTELAPLINELSSIARMLNGLYSGLEKKLSP